MNVEMNSDDVLYMYVYMYMHVCLDARDTFFL